MEQRRQYAQVYILEANQAKNATCMREIVELLQTAIESVSHTQELIARQMAEVENEEMHMEEEGCPHRLEKIRHSVG